MKVLILGNFPESAQFIKGGVQASVYGLAVSLAQLSTVEEIRGVSLPSKDETQDHEEIIGGIPVLFLSTPFSSLASGIFRLSVLCKHGLGGRDTIHHLHGTGLVVTLMIVIYRLTRRPFVWTIHGIVEKEFWDNYQQNSSISNLLYYIFYLILERLSLFLAYDIIVDTQYVFEVIKRRTKANVHIIPQGIFREEFSHYDPLMHSDPKKLVSVGVISKRKGHHLLIQSFNRAYRKNKGLSLTIVGAILEADYLDDINQLVDRLNLQNVVSIKTNLPKIEVIRILSKSDIFVLHSQEESQGIAICEALATGLPVVASDVGGIPNVVKHEHSGFLVQPNDFGRFSERILELIEDKELYTSMSKNALTDSKSFDWQAIAEKVFNVYCIALSRI